MKTKVCEFCDHSWVEHKIDKSPSGALNWLCPPPTPAK